jgi:hypothetical protein
MKGHLKTVTRLSQMAILLFVLFGLQALTAFGQNNIDPAAVKERERRQKACFSAFDAAAPIVYGYDMKLHVWRNDYWQTYLMMDPAWRPKYDEGLKFTDAVAWMKEGLAGDGAGEGRALVINNAYQEVYGREATPAEHAYWEPQVKAQKAWYATIALGEIGKLNSNGSERGAMISRAYHAVMGRGATRADFAYWYPLKDHYRQIVQAARSYLYSASGTTDLAATMARALQTNNGSQPSDAQVKAAILKYTPNKWIYAEITQKALGAK